jgi:hypothetical protein
MSWRVRSVIFVMAGLFVGCTPAGDVCGPVTCAQGQECLRATNGLEMCCTESNTCRGSCCDPQWEVCVAPFGSFQCAPRCVMSADCATGCCVGLLDPSTGQPQTGGYCSSTGPGVECR